MLDLLLTYPYYPNETFYRLIFDWHLGAGYILAYLKKMGVSADCFVHQAPAPLQDIVQQILKSNPKIVGFSCYDVNYYFVKLISRALKKNNKDITIIIGGPSATFSDELILNDEPSIDICVRGEGEQTVFELIRCLKTEKNLKSIKGITYRMNGSIVRATDRPLVVESNKNYGLDIYPSPYLSGIFPRGLSRGILTSRGCIYRCIYCNFAAMSRWTVRYHSVERVIEELKVINANKPGSLVFIYDDNFLLNKMRAKAICRRIIKEKITLCFHCTGRPDNIDNELLELMKESNFKFISIGLESAVLRNLRTINKVGIGKQESNNLLPEKRYIKKIRTLSHSMRKIGLNLEISIITGLPKENKREAEYTVDFVDKLSPHKCYHDFLTIYPGTPLFSLRKSFYLDVVQPKTILPFKTKFSFDVTKIKLSRYAFPNFRFMESLIWSAIKILSRMVSEPQKNQEVREIFLQRDVSSLSRLIEEHNLRKYLILSPLLLLMCESDRRIEREFYGLITQGIPLINLLLLMKLQDKGSHRNFLRIYKLILLTEVIERRRLPLQEIALFTLIPFSRLDRDTLKEIVRLKNERFDRKIIMLSLNNEADKTIFTKSILDSTHLRRLMDSCPTDFYIANACQWVNKSCPAVAENTLYVDRKGAINFCSKNCFFKTGNKALCFLETPSNTERKKYFQYIEKRRGCSSCRVSRVCSKCINTHPFTEKEFCSLRKKVNTDGFVRFFTAHNVLESLIRYKTADFS